MTENKILLDIYIPAAEKTVEIRVDKGIMIAGLKEVIIEYVKNLNDSPFVPDASSTLCDAATGQEYNPGSYIGHLNLKNGSKILLI